MPAVSGLVRTMAVSPRVHLANPKKNAEEIASLLRTADAQGVQLCVFPQLCLTGSTCGDLFAQPMLLDGAKEALAALLALPVKTAFVVGLPLVIGGRLYNCSAVVCAGKLALVPTAADSHLFADGASAPQSAMLFGHEVPVGTDLLIDCGSFTFSITDGSSASMAVAAQALIAVHPDAQNETCGRHSMRRRAALQHSEDGLCGYVYAGAGYGESTTDMVFSGYAGVCEEGVLLAENERFARVSSFAIADIDADRLRYRRIAKRSRHAAAPQKEMRSVCMQAPGYPAAAHPLRPLGTLPFVPDNDDDMRDILMIMTQGLIMRMEHIGLKKAVLGVSGGLDSTLTLLAAAFAFDRAGWDRKNIVGITMPGMGTGKRTKGNAEKLMELIGCTALEIPIGASVAQHFADIGQQDRRAGAGHGRPERTGAGLVHLQRRPHEHVQYERFHPQDADPQPVSLGGRAAWRGRDRRRAGYPRHADLTGADSGQGRRTDAAHGGYPRRIPAQRLLPLSHDGRRRFPGEALCHGLLRLQGTVCAGSDP